jgi:hypothetical protein
MTRTILAAAFAALAMAGTASANCDIFNDTKWDFKVESGNTSNQSVGAHTHTSIHSGKIIGKSTDGKAVSGTCKDGDKLVVKDDGGVAILMPE